MKNNRKMKVYGKIFFCPKCRVMKVHSNILLQGKWLAKAGFEFGNNINVEVLNNQLIITKL